MSDLYREIQQTEDALNKWERVLVILWGAFGLLLLAYFASQAFENDSKITQPEKENIQMQNISHHVLQKNREFALPVLNFIDY